MTWLAADAAAPARATSSAEGEGIAMDTEKLIEEAGRWAEHVRQSPGNGTAGEDRYLAGLLDKLAAALKASEERARKAEELAAANLAANKRIVELERERDEARAELARLTTPRPIAEAPKDGAWIGAIWEDMDAEDCQCYGPIAVVKWRGTGWEDSDGDGYEPPSHFLPLPVLP